MPHRLDTSDVAAAGDGHVSELPAEPSPISPRKILWPVALSLVVLAAIGYFTFEPREFRQVVDGINPWPLAAAFGALFMRVYFGGLRLDFISHGRLGIAGGLRGQLAWDFFSNVAPSAVGGAPFAAVYVARDKGIGYGETTAYMVFSIILDQLWFALTIPIVIVASMYFEVIPASVGEVGTAGIMLYFFGMLAWISVFGYATLFRPDILQRITSRLFRLPGLRRFHDRVDYCMDQLRSRARVLRSQPPTFYVKGLLLTFGAWACKYLLLLFVVWSFYAEFHKVLLLFRTAAMTLGSLVLPTPGGAGGMEALYALFIGTLIPSAIVAPTLLLWRFLAFYMFIGLGAVLTTHHVQRSIRQRLDDGTMQPELLELEEEVS